MFSTPIVLKYKISNKTNYVLVDPGIFASKKHYNMFLAPLGDQMCLQIQGMPSQTP